MTSHVQFGLVELDLLATYAASEIPFPLQVPSFGEVPPERDLLFASAGETLELRGLADEDGPLDLAEAPLIDVVAGANELRVTASVAIGALAAAAWPLRVGLTAVVADRAGRQAYYALRHTRDKPDFHDAASFAVSLGEFGATTVIARADAPTVPVTIARATRPMSAVSHVAASAIACGNTVAPSRVSPCSASSNGMIGMPSRVRSKK